MTQWEYDFKHSPFAGLFEEYLEMGKENDHHCFLF